MYKVYVDNTLLYQPNIEELVIENPNLQFTVNTSGIFDFTIRPINPCYSLIKKMKSIVEVYDNNNLIYRGRVLNDTLGIDKERKIECEGELSYLNDSIFRAYDFRGPIADLLKKIIDSHNSQVGATKRFELGNVTVTDPKNYIDCSSIEAKKSWSIIEEELISVLGGYINLKRVNGKNYIDYLADSGLETKQKIELGQNLLDFTRVSRGDKMITGIIPYGAKLKNEKGEETDIRMDIKSVNNGVDYLINNTAKNEYDIILDTKVWNDITTPEQLKSAAQKYLDSHAVFNNITSIKAIDLNMLDRDIEKLKFFHYVTIVTKEHDFEQKVLIRKQSLDLLNVQNNVIEVESSFDSLTSKQHQADKIIKKINSDYITNEKVKKMNSEIIERVTEVESEIIQLPEKINLAVSEKTYTKTQTDTKISNTESGLNGKINDVQANLDNLVIGSQNILRATDFENMPLDYVKEYWRVSLSFSYARNTFAVLENTPMYDVNVLRISNPTDMTLVQSFFNPKGNDGNEYIKLKPNTEYTYSFWVRADARVKDVYIRVWKYDDDGSNRAANAVGVTKIVQAGIPTKIIYKFKTTDKQYYQPRVYFNYNLASTASSIIFLSFMQLEEGNVATSYQPSIADYTTQIETIQTKAEITMLADNLNLAVEKNVELGERITKNEASINLTDNKIQQEIVDRTSESGVIRQELASRIIQLSDSFNLEFTRLDKDVDTVTNGLNEFKTYYRFTADGAIIGKSGNPFELTINNREIQFLENGSAVAYINGQKMYIESLEILESIILGYHQIEKYDGLHKGTIVRMI
jgi:hypothetical protein